MLPKADTQTPYWRDLLTRVVDRAGAPFEARGIDVSKYQGEIDWPAVRAAGYDFAIIKLTEGVGYMDPKAHKNVGGARAAGLGVMAYHFGTWFNADADRVMDDANAEARWHRKIRGQVGIEPGARSWLDIEWDGRGRGKDITPDLLVMWALRWLISADYPAGIYTGPSFHKYKLGGTQALARYPLWLADYRKEPREFKYKNLLRAVYQRKGMQLGSWRTTIHQQTGKGSVPGIKGNCDVNLFRGTRAEFEAMF